MHDATPHVRGSRTARFLVGLALLGLVTTTVPLLSQLTGVPVICGPFDRCNELLAHPGSRLAGVPIAALGALAFIGVLVAATRLHRSEAAVAVILALALGAGGASVWLQIRIHASLGLVCPWCVASAGAMAVIGLLTLWLRRTPRTERPSLRPRYVGIGLGLAALFIVGEFVLMLRQ